MGLVRTLITDFRKSARREINASRLQAANALVFLTYRCTSSCKTCNIWKWGNREPELDWKDWKDILCGLRDYGINSVEIFGGDALLRKDMLFEFIAYCSRIGLETFMPTNSILLDPATASGLADSGLGTIYLSLDGVGASHDRIRGKENAFDRVKEAIELVACARKNGRPRIVIISTISRLNYIHFDRIVQFLNDYRVDAIYARPVEEYSAASIEASVIEGIRPRPYFISSDGVSHLLSQAEAAEFRQILKKAKTASKTYVNARVFVSGGNALFSIRRKAGRCLVCSTLMVLDPRGRVVPCPMYTTYVLGKLPGESLSEIWGNALHRNFIRHQRAGEIKICSHCTLGEYYPGLSRTALFYLKCMADRL